MRPLIVHGIGYAVVRGSAQGTQSVAAAAVGQLGFQVVIYDDETPGDIYASGVWAATAP